MKNLLYILAFTITLASCSMEAEEEISWNIEKHPDMLVVHSVITNEYKEQSVYLTLTNSYFDNSTPRSVSSAVIVVEGGIKPIRFNEKADAPGLYVSEEPFACEPQRTYKLTITLAQNINGQDTYTALSRMPEGLDIDSIQCELYEMPEFEEEGGEDKDKDKDTTIIGIRYFGHEPQQAENFYFTRVFVNDKLAADNPTEYEYFRITSENTTYVHGIPIIQNAKPSDNIKFRLYAIEKKYYKYLEAIHKMEETGNAYSMSGAPANAIGNISEGKGLGYFLAAYVSEKTSPIIDKRKNKSASL